MVVVPSSMEILEENYCCTWAIKIVLARGKLFKINWREGKFPPIIFSLFQKDHWSRMCKGITMVSTDKRAYANLEMVIITPARDDNANGQV